MPTERRPTGCAFGIVAHDPQTATFGIALAASSLAIGSRCPYIAPEKAAISSQGFTNLKTGPLALDLIQRGMTADEVIEALRRHDRWMDYRQIAIISESGGIAAHTGQQVLGWAGHEIGDRFVCLANSLPDDRPLLAIRESYESDRDPSMAKRLLRAIEAGGEALAPGQVLHSASLRVTSRLPLEEIDLRIDRAHARLPGPPNSLADLRDLYELYSPFAEIYHHRSETPPLYPEPVSSVD